jgi:T3SS (YopN, CesT) and YbjN peptide-binding chaperone 3
MTTGQWSRRAQDLCECLSVAHAAGGGLVTVRLTSSEAYLLCHVTGSLVVGEAAGNTALGDAAWMEGADVDRMVALGWLPPGSESVRWQRRWDLERFPDEVVECVIEVVRVVYRGSPACLVIESRGCGDAACAVHGRDDLRVRRSRAVVRIR